MGFTYPCRGCIDGRTESWTGSVRPLSPSGHTEFEIRSRGSVFHLVIGRHSRSDYVYIPTLAIAVDISHLDDRFWNMEQLLQNYPGMSPVDAVSIVDALAAIKENLY